MFIFSYLNAVLGKEGALDLFAQANEKVLLKLFISMTKIHTFEHFKR